MQYVKIKDTIVEQIDSGMLAPRQKLPTERKFAEMFDTTRVTLREALSILEAEGKIYREDRRGWFISPQPLRYDPASMTSFSKMAQLQQRQPSSELLSAKKVLANKPISARLELPPFSDVYMIERVRYLEGRPVVYVKNHIKPDCFPDLLGYDCSTSLTDIYRNNYGVEYNKTRYRIGSTCLMGGIAQGLRATSGTLAMLIERTNYNKQDQMIDCVTEYWRHDAICIESLVVQTKLEANGIR